ncbi:MAG: hypothetical protein A2854_00730 [Parcubacteria group bacterium RIFCSPHIGHO2_01_FULL_56_18]|nr:MAG: hypothetical protein A2854_00730 [Parcubacteria group bacterium RIFCSPHIGHO2_01_FULL_56_18]
MNTPSLRCGIIGAGTFAHLHAKAMSHLPFLKLSAICDTERVRCEKFSSVWGGKVFGDFHLLLEQEDLDIITIATPDETHGEITAGILNHPQAPRLLVVEKPLCTSRNELVSIGSLLQSHSTQIVVNHSRRFNAGFHRLRELIRSGEFGTELLSARWQYYAGWLHIGVHVVDTLRMLIGEISCKEAHITGIDRYAEDPLLTVSLRSEIFPNASIDVQGVPEDPYGLLEGELFFPKGRIRIEWGDIFIDRLGKGHSSAPILRFDEHRTADSPLQTMESLYTSCHAFLRDDDKRLLEEAGFAEVQRTMTILFDACSQARA